MKCPVCKKNIPNSALKCPYCKSRTGLLCSRCNTVNSLGSVVCQKCSQELLKICPHCNGVNFPDAVKCRKCGLALEKKQTQQSENSHLEFAPKFFTRKQALDILVDGLMSRDKKIFSIAGEKGIGLKNVTMNEEFFQGHFPNNPVMPGVLQIEAMAQTAGALVLASMEKKDGKQASVFFMSIDGVKFRKPVKPGDQLRMHVEKIKARRNVFVFRGESKVDGQVVSEAEFTAMIVE